MVYFSLRPESVKKYGNPSSSTSQLGAWYWDFQEHTDGHFLCTSGCICIFGCWDDFLGWSSHLFFLSAFPSIPPASSALSLHAENKTISLLCEYLTIISPTHLLWQHGNMSSMVQPNGEQEPFWKQFLLHDFLWNQLKVGVKKKK